MAAPLNASDAKPLAAQTGPAGVLLVDDEPKNLVALEAVLAGPDRELVKAASGKEALRCLMQRDFAAILLDVQMPDMDGFETATLIRSRDRNRQTPIVFLTAVGTSEQEVVRGYESGAVDYLLKPFAPEILRHKVSVLVDLHRKNEQVRHLHAELQRHVQRLEDGNRRLQAENQERRLAEEKLLRSEERLTRLNGELELRVQERTADLERRGAELERSNQELAQYAAVTSHDLQEPLRTMGNYLQLLERDLAGGLSAEQKKTLDVVQASCQHMHRMISDLLAFSQVGNGDFELMAVDCGALVAGILTRLDGLIRSSQARVEVAKLPTVMAEPGLLAEVFQNLISNALKFRREEAPWVELGCEREGREWHFWVRDHGIGIEAVHFNKLFKLFRRLHSRDDYPGSGLGLSICKKIIERHNGRIWLESEPGQGSTFHFTVPVPA